MSEEKKPNCLGVDVGSHRIGVAVHPEGMTQSMPFETVNGKDRKQAAARVMDIVEERGVSVLVFGWPVDMDGVPRRATRRVDKFIDLVEQDALSRGVTLEVVRWDERLTTTAAESFLIGADVSRSRRKEVVDQIAAAHILEGYLSQR